MENQSNQQSLNSVLANTPEYRKLKPEEQFHTLDQLSDTLPEHHPFRSQIIEKLTIAKEYIFGLQDAIDNNMSNTWPEELAKAQNIPTTMMYADKIATISVYAQHRGLLLEGLTGAAAAKKTSAFDRLLQACEENKDTDALIDMMNRCRKQDFGQQYAANTLRTLLRLGTNRHSMLLDLFSDHWCDRPEPGEEPDPDVRYGPYAELQRIVIEDAIAHNDVSVTLDLLEEPDTVVHEDDNNRACRRIATTGSLQDIDEAIQRMEQTDRRDSAPYVLLKITLTKRQLCDTYETINSEELRVS